MNGVISLNLIFQIVCRLKMIIDKNVADKVVYLFFNWTISSGEFSYSKAFQTVDSTLYFIVSMA